MIRNRDSKVRTLRWALNLACLIALAAGLIVFYRTFYLPVTASQQSDLDRISQLEEFVQTGDAVRREHNNLIEVVAAEERRAQEMLGRIPVTPDDAEFQQQMIANAAEADLKIDDYQRGTIKEQDGLAQLDVKMVCRGKYEAICRFLDQLTQLHRVVNIDRMEIQAVTDEDGCILALYLILYFDPQRGTKPPAGIVAGQMKSLLHENHPSG